MDFLTKEIAKRKAQVEIRNDLDNDLNNDLKPIGEKRKYTEEDEKLREVQLKQRVENRRLARKKENEEIEFYKKQKIDNKLWLKKMKKSKIIINETEIIKELRCLNEPVKIFGESLKDKFQRLIDAREKQKSIEQEKLENEIEKDLDMKVNFDDIKSNKSKIFRQIHKYFLFLLKTWDQHLDSIQESEKEKEKEFKKEIFKEFEINSLNESNSLNNNTIKSNFIFQQTVEYLNPLLQKLRKHDLPATNMFKPLSKMVLHMQKREYSQATEQYMLLSIGNAAWPIGVTSVGIHERSADQRITGYAAANTNVNANANDNINEKEGYIAHSMSDETTRKWLMALKRLITFAETQWPQ